MIKTDSQNRITRLLLNGTFIATACLSALLVLFDIIVHSTWFGGYLWTTLATLGYLTVGEVLFRRGQVSMVNWMLIIFYEILAFSTLFAWGLNAPVGILTISFAVILSSVLMRPKYVFPVVLFTMTALVLVQLLHSQGIASPNLITLSQPSTYWDVITYSTILAIFALISWIGGSQREKTLNRALAAELELQGQRDTLRTELEKQSIALRSAQLEQIRELHKFAILGQSAAATLHELSSHLSVLNIDIDDLRQQHTNSEAIANAEESIRHINKMVHQAQQQLGTYDKREAFNVIKLIERGVKDVKVKSMTQDIRLEYTPAHGASYMLNGSPVALLQIFTILLNNALEACCSAQNPQVTILLKSTSKHYMLSVLDNGPGIPSDLHPSLFKPLTSTKPTGMGVGLYIASHLLENQFNGSIRLKPTKKGAHFTMIIPKSSA